MLFTANRPKLCGDRVFPRNFHTMKLGEISVFDAVFVILSPMIGNVQPLRNAQRWDGGNPFCYGALLEAEGVQVIPLRNTDKISQLVFI